MGGAEWCDVLGWRHAGRLREAGEGLKRCVWMVFGLMDGFAHSSDPMEVESELTGYSLPTTQYLLHGVLLLTPGASVIAILLTIHRHYLCALLKGSTTKMLCREDSSTRLNTSHSPLCGFKAFVDTTLESSISVLFNAVLMTVWEPRGSEWQVFTRELDSARLSS